MEKNNLLEEITDWFTSIKAPDLKDKIGNGLSNINAGVPLEGNYKKLFGFMLFSYSMNHGPLSFIEAEMVAEEIGVTEEMKIYTNDWINHAKKQLETPNHDL